MVEACSPVRAVSLIHFHSVLDTSVPYEGGFGDGFTQTIWKPPIDSVMEVWSEMNGCSAEPDTIYEQDGVLGRRWSDCDDGSEVVVYLTSDGGHSWPGGNPGTPGADPPSSAISASDMMWEFFAQHTLTGTSDSPEYFPAREPEFMLHPVFPNPFNSELTLTLSGFTRDVRISLHNLLGQEVAVIHDGLLSSTQLHYAAPPSLASGLYFIRASSIEFSTIQKIVLLK